MARQSNRECTPLHIHGHLIDLNDEELDRARRLSLLLWVKTAHGGGRGHPALAPDFFRGYGLPITLDNPRLIMPLLRSEQVVSDPSNSTPSEEARRLYDPLSFPLLQYYHTHELSSTFSGTGNTPCQFHGVDVRMIYISTSLDLL